MNERYTLLYGDKTAIYLPKLYERLPIGQVVDPATWHRVLAQFPDWQVYGIPYDSKRIGIVRMDKGAGPKVVLGKYVENEIPTMHWDGAA